MFTKKYFKKGLQFIPEYAIIIQHLNNRRFLNGEVKMRNTF